MTFAMEHRTIPVAATLDELIAFCVRAEDLGEAVDRAALLARHPQYADDLRRFFADGDRLRTLARPLAASSRAAHLKLRYVGDYELLEEIACGGMGVVYKARQSSLKRIVAVKMILAGHLASADDLKRFRAEAEAAANLHHPHIVAVHEVGVHQGQHYFSMDYVAGRSLAEMVREHPLAPRDAARYVRDMAAAVHYAHQQGTLHRDLKPSNVLIDSDDQVRITDFGLALRVSEDRGLTRTGQALGTPSYMAPEQARGLRSLIGPPSDVYSLGAVLYELLTGRPPFRADTAVETLRQAMHEDPATPRMLNPRTPRDLETICLKCLEKEPHKRYLTAQQLGDDLSRYLADEPIQARPISVPARLWRWRRRNPIVASLTAAAAMLLVAVAGMALVAYVREARLHAKADRLSGEIQRAYGDVTQLQAKENELTAKVRTAEQELQQAEHRTTTLEGNLDDLEKQRRMLLSTLEGRQQKLYSTLLNLAQADWEAGEVMRADAYLEDCPSHLRDQRWSRLKHLCHPQMRSFPGTQCLAISPDGRRIASVRERSTPPSERQPDLKPTSRDENSAAWEIVVSDIATQRMVQTMPCTETIQALAFSPDGRTLISGGEHLILWDVESGKLRHELPGHAAPTTCLSLSEEGRLLASASYHEPERGVFLGEVLLWDLEARTLRRKLPGLATVALDPAGKRVAYCTTEIRQVNGQAKAHRIMRIEPVDPHEEGDSQPGFSIDGYYAYVVFSSDGSLLFLGDSQSVEIWNVVERQRLFRFDFPTYKAGRANVAFSRDGTRFAYAVRGEKRIRERSADSAFVWNVHPGERERILPWYDTEISATAFTPDGHFLATVDRENVKLWDITPSADPTEAILADIRQMNVRPYDWPQWGGSRYRVNTPSGTNIPSDWDPGKFDRKTGAWLNDGARNIKWVARLGTQTYGNPIIANGKIFVGTNNGAGYLKRYPAEVDLGVLLCFQEASGKFLWQHSNEKLPTGRVHDWPLQGVCSTPAVDGDRLWYVTNRGHVVCLDTEGFADGEDDGPEQGVLPSSQFAVVANYDPTAEIAHGASPGGAYRNPAIHEPTLHPILRSMGLPLPANYQLTVVPGKTEWVVQTYAVYDKDRKPLYRLTVEEGEFRVRAAGAAPADPMIASAPADLTAGLNEGVVNASLRAVFGRQLPVDCLVETIEPGQAWSITGADEDGAREFRLRRSGAMLVCNAPAAKPWDHEADVVWRLDMIGQLGVSPHNMSNCSPLIVDDWLFVCTSNGLGETHINLPAPDAPSFIALDRWTGELLWTDNSPGKNILHAQWASPGYGVFNGQPQVIFPGGDGWVYSFDPRGNGRGGSKLLWKFDGNFKDSKYMPGGQGPRNEIIAFPAIYDGLVYIVMGQDPEHGEGEGCLWCIDPAKHLDGVDVSEELAVDRHGNVIPHKKLQAVDPALGERAIPNPNSAVVWRYTAQDRDGDGVIMFEEEFHRSISIPVIKDDLLYVADFSGLFHCLNAKTGKAYWSCDLLAACWNSALLVDDKVFIGDEDGDMAIFRHSADPEKAMKDLGPWYGEINMGDSVYMTPVVANDVLYIATRRHLFAIAPD
jgi:outer membrane protein assembly factor BamB/tRNA A-37 threonylcarbamoyl transferase component Bud32